VRLPSHEVLLQLLVVGFYLQDSLQALAPNEAVLVRGWRGRWHAAFGQRGWKIAGRELLLPNPFTPHRPLFRLAWRMEGSAEATQPKPARELTVPPDIDRLRPFVIVAGLALFVLLPLGLFSRAGTLLAIAAVVLLYVNNLLALSLAYRWRDRLGVDKRRLVSMALECLACAPYGLNLVRRLCALTNPQEDFTQAARRLIPSEELQSAHAQCLARIEEQIDTEPEGSRRSAQLQAAKARFSS
jgi:hypothetical protein